MNNHILIRIAIKSILHHKGRSLLTTLGIMIGIAAIIAMLAIGHGAEERVKQEILAGGKNSIYIHGGKMHMAPTKQQKKAVKDLSFADVAALKRFCPTIEKISPVVYTSQSIKYLTNTIEVQIKGGDEDFIPTVGRKMALGLPLLPNHIQHNTRVIVLGSKAAQDLFKSFNPIGQLVHINNIPFMVIGVLDRLASQWGGQFYDANLDCIVPITTAKKYFLHTLGNKVNGICVSAKRHEDIPDLVKQIGKHLRMRHHLEFKDADDFTIYDQESMLKAAQAASGVFTLFLLIVAFISLLVGGIGVMNIMLVSVGERTNEIGIRMALGAQEKMILKQFLFEAFVLCGIGGIIGTALGIATPFVTSLITGWMVVIKPQTILIAASAIFLIGLIFGYYPAHRASQLNPVDALMEK